MSEQPVLEDVPLIYPMVRLAFTTVAIVDGKPVEIMGDEVFDLKVEGDNGARVHFSKMLTDFRKYMKAIQATRLTPDVLQRILDSQPLAAPKTEGDPQASLLPALEATLGNHSSGLPVESPPETASESARTPSAGTVQEE